MLPPDAHSQVSTIDVAPTVLELAGLEVIPYKDELDGVSLVQYLRGLPVGEDPNLIPAVGGAVRSHLFIEAPYHRAVVQAGSGWKYARHCAGWLAVAGCVPDVDCAVCCSSQILGKALPRCRRAGQESKQFTSPCCQGSPQVIVAWQCAVSGGVA